MADRIIERESDNAAGWVVAIVVLAVVIIGGLLLYQRSYNTTPGVPNTGTDVNVTVPDTSGTGGSSGATTGTGATTGGSTNTSGSATTPGATGSGTSY